MAQRPTPISVAVCTLIALHSDPASRIHDKKSTSSSCQQLGEHLANVIQHFVFSTNNNISSSSSSREMKQGTAAWSMSRNHHDRTRNRYCSQSVYSKDLVATSIEAMPLAYFLRMVSGSDGRFHHVAQFLLEDLNTTASSIDSLIDLYSALRSTVAKGCIDGDSAHGIYVRKRCLGFDQLNFESVGRFWESVAVYVEAAVDWDSECQNHDRGEVSSVQMDNESDIKQSDNDDVISNRMIDSSWLDLKRSWPLSPSQISKTMMQQCFDLRDNICQISAEEMEWHLQLVLNENPELTMAHFARLLNCVHHDERVGALEHFHRYFDYAMIQERKDRLAMPLGSETGGSNGGAGGTGAAGGINNNHNANPHHGDGADGRGTKRSLQRRNLAQYVTVVLAALFHELGYEEMALMATQEAIKVAQQSGDEVCLAYALGWINSLAMCSHPSNNRKERLQSLESAFLTSGEYGLGSLIAGTSFQRAAGYVSDMTHDARSQNLVTSERVCRTFHPASTWEAIAAASANRTIGGMNAIGHSIRGYDVATNLSSFSNGGYMSNVFAQQSLVASGLWQSVGRQNMALVANAVSVHCYGSQPSEPCLSEIAANVVTTVMCGGSSEDKRFTRKNQATASTSCTLENLNQLRMKAKERRATDREVSKPDVYSNALDFIHAEISKKYNNINKGIMCALSQIHLQALSQRLDIHRAEAYDIFLASQSLGSARKNIKNTVHSMGSSCLLLCRRGMYEDAKDMITSVIIPFCERNKLHYFRCFFLLQLSAIFVESCDDDPSCAIPSILDCLSLSEDLSIDSIHASALSLLAKVHFEMGNIERAYAMIKASMPILLKHGHDTITGQAWLTLAKCSLAWSTGDKRVRNLKVRDMSKPNIFLKRALGQLQRSAEYFGHAHDITSLMEVNYLMAHVCNKLPFHLALRDEASRAFVSLSSKKTASVLPISCECLSHMLLKNEIFVD